MNCTKTNCKNLAVKNRKRCEDHKRRTSAPAPAPAPARSPTPASASAPVSVRAPLSSYEPTDDEYNNVLKESLEIYERRLLVEEQNKEYEEAVKKDQENMQKLEEKKRDNERLDKLYKNDDNDVDDVFNVKFKFDNFTVVRKFKKLSSANYMIEYVKYVLRNKNIKHENLKLYTNFPKISIDENFAFNLADNTVIYVSYDIIH